MNIHTTPRIDSNKLSPTVAGSARYFDHSPDNNPSRINLIKHAVFQIGRLRLARYAAVGFGATVCHYAIMITVLHSGATAVFATTLGAVAGMIVSYLLNARFTFGTPTNSSRTITRFVTVAGIGLFTNTAIVALCTLTLGLWVWIAQICATSAVLFLTFFLNRHWSFAG